MYYAVTGQERARRADQRRPAHHAQGDPAALHRGQRLVPDAEGKIGTIEEGRFGDLIVLSTTTSIRRKVTDEEIKDIHSVLTVVNGKVVHDNLDGRKRMYWNRESRGRH